MNIIGHKHIYLGVSALLVLSSMAVIGIWGLKLGIDFTGGSLLEVEFTGERPSVDKIRDATKIFELGGLVVQPAGEKGFILRFKYIEEELHQKLLQTLKEAGGENDNVIEKRFDTIGPTIGGELKNKAVLALILAVFSIIAYIAWSFRRVSRPVSSWKYGVVAVVALAHDVAIPGGLFAVLGRFWQVEVDAFFVTALLTIMGFSVHDTIVVFDRIRENLNKLNGVEAFPVIVNRSINETIARSVNTSLTIILTLVTVFLWGGGTTKYFSLALTVGIVVGTYSSIFVASPLIVIWNQLTGKR